MIIEIPHEAAMMAFAGRLAKCIPPSCVIGLSGELGAGKTTFCRGFLRALGFQGVVRSPTYTLVETYDIAGKHISHFDLYRLQSPVETHDLGWEEGISLIEWPEKGNVPVIDIDVQIIIEEAMTRRIVLQARTEIGRALLEKLT